MALVLADRVRDTTTTTGTGTVTLSGTAPTGYQNFSVIGNANTTYYTINSDTQWEVGVGTYTSSGTTLSRNTVLASSNGGALVDFAAGTKDVFVTYPSEKAVTEDYGNALAATTAANLAGGAAGSIPYQTAANTTAMLATGTGVLIGGTTPSYTASPSLTQVTVAGDPSTALQVATKQYVDGLVSSGITYHTPVKYEVPNTTGNLNALYNQPGGAGNGVGATLTNNGTLAAFAPDGPTASVSDRILVYNQTSAFQNGVYTVTTVGSGSVAWVLTRATDADTYGLKSPNSLGDGDSFFVTSGDTGAGETYVMNTSGTITFGVTAITFVQVSDATLYTAGNGLQLTGGTVFSLIAPVTTVNGGTGLTAFTSGGAVYATSTSALTTGTLPATAGGTGFASYTTGDLLYASSSTALSALADIATGNALISGGVGTAPSYGKIGLTTHISGTLAVGNGGTGATTLTGYLVGNGTSAFTATATIPTSALSGTISLTTQVSGTLGAGNGGTGISSYTVGDILYASGTTALSSLADVATGNALISGGVSNAPLWGKIGLTTHVSGTLPVSNGGSGATTLTGYLKGNGTSAFTASATIPSGDITGAALTKADDTNVTLTLGGSPSTALLAATSITAGWSGQLAVSRGGTGNSTLTSGYLLKGNGVSPTSASVIYDDGTNVGIGTTVPSQRVSVGASAGTIGYGIEYSPTDQQVFALTANLATGEVRHFADTNYFPTFYANNAERMRIDSSGNLALGTSTAANRLTVSAAGLDITSGIAINGTSMQGIRLQNTLNDNSSLGLWFGTNNVHWAGISGQRTNFAGDWTTDLRFYTHEAALVDVTYARERMRIAGDGSVTAYVDMRAPIFYDSNNTSYYVDPAGSSVLGIITAQSTNDVQLYLNGNGTSWAGISWADATATDYIWYNGSTSTFAIGGGGSAVANKKLHINGGTTIGSGIAATASGTNSLLVEASITANQMYSQIFYDSQNGAYYVDPAGTSNLNVLNVQPNNTTSGGGINFNGAGNAFIRGTNVDNAVAGGSNLQLQSWFGIGFGPSISGQLVPIGENAVWINARDGDLTARRILVAQQDARAPIFYDNNNTAYYINGDGTSNLAGLTVANEITGSVSGFSRYLPTAYIGGQQLNPQTYFSSSIGLKVAMTAVAGVWSDTLWINGYAGGDVPNMCALHTSRQATPRMWISSQSDAGTSYGTLYEFPTLGYNSGNTNGLYAGVFYDSANTARYFDGTTGINFTTGSSSRVTVYSDDSGLHVANGEGVGGDVRLGAAYNLPGLYNNPNLYLQSESGIYFHTGNTQRGYFDGSSNLFANASMRAPIFYDSNNTNYYLNPESTSVLWEAATYYLRNIEDVSVNHEYGLYFSNNRSTAYAIYREAGAWTSPFPDLRIAFHTGIKIGANPTYNGVRFYTDYDMSSQVMSVNNGSDPLGGSNVFVNNSLQAGSSLRAPIFYDSNDTGYYLDLNSTSEAAMRMRGGALIGPNTSYGAYLRIGASGWTGDHSSVFVTNGNLHLDAQPGFSLYLAWYNTSTINVGGAIVANGNITAFSDIRIKANIETIPNALDKLDQIRGVTYTRTDRDDKERRYAGVIAQEIEQVLPEAIFENEEYKSVDYNATIGLLIQAVKELTDKVKALEAKE